MKTNNNIIVIIVLFVIIVAGIFYFLKLNSNNESVATVDTTDTGNVLIPSEDIEDNSITNESQTANILSINDERFNNAMKNASSAFVKGDYNLSIKEYKQAIAYKDVDTAHAGLFNVYGAQNDWRNAQKELDKAITLNPSYAGYWKWKLTMLDEKMDMAYDGLKLLYQEAYLKVDPKTKIDIVTHFATISEYNGKKNEAIILWKEASVLYPKNRDIYEAQIKSLESLN